MGLNDMEKHTQEKPAILYIEDDPASKKLLQGMVNHFPHIQLITAWSAEEGIKLAGLHLPKLIFLDINLPSMSGREAISHLHENTQLAATTIIALSADAIPAHIASAMELGFHDYLTKPIDLLKIKSIIEKIF